MRHLATVQKILAIDPIPGADSIEVATILGWKCVVKKGEFAVGDLVVYIEVDSLLPDRPEFEFMRPRGMRVRTVKLRGQVSQGLAMPMSILDGVKNMMPTEHGEMYEIPWEDDDDVTDVLGITKYEAPIPAQLSGQMKGTFPSFIPKTDEERIQSCPEVLTKYGRVPCRVCEKLDGSSVTYYLRDGVFGVCSRNMELLETEGNSFWRVAQQMDIENKMRSIGRLGSNIAIQGELIGEGIQGNKYGIRGQTAYFFNVYDIDKCQYRNVAEAEDFIWALDLPMVPNVAQINTGDHDVQSLVDMVSDLRSALNPHTLAEGVVVRSYDNMVETFQTPDGPKHVDRGRLSFKVISPSFLLKHGE